MHIRTITSESEIILPDSFRCPICNAAIEITEVSEWTRDDDEAYWKAGPVKIDCVTFPGFDDIDAFESFQRSHWSTPYIDWLPLEKRVTDWVNNHYAWQL